MWNWCDFEALLPRRLAQSTSCADRQFHNANASGVKYVVQKLIWYECGNDLFTRKCGGYYITNDIKLCQSVSLVDMSLYIVDILTTEWQGIRYAHSVKY